MTALCPDRIKVGANRGSWNYFCIARHSGGTETSWQAGTDFHGVLCASYHRA